MATKHFTTGSSSNSSSDYASGYDDQTSRVGSSSNPPYNYEVFLSFNGDDTRYGFTDYLYHALVNRGIRVYRDKESLHVGQEIDKLLEAITTSKILVPIISTNYASSEWCLKELVQILKCNKASARLVLPIFYKVKPSYIRRQKGQFGEEFERFKEKHNDNNEFIQEVEQAFKKIASLKGWESNKFADGYEGQLVEAVAKRIFNELRKTILNVPEFLVGVEEHVKKIMKMIHAKPSNEAKFIAIHGMGGIGKITLAKVLYNELSNHFDSHSFIPNIREASSTYKGIVDLQKQVISNVLVGELPREISTVDEGITIIENSFKGKKLLLLLDDVSDKDKLNKLAEKNNWFGSESVVIITTRNNNVIKASTVNLSYELNELTRDQSYELFCNHAFEMGAPCPSNLEHVAKDIVFMTGGLPLAVEVIGRLLYQKSEGFWRDTLNKLRKIPNSKVLDRLMLSYKALDDNQQQIFLDIAYLPANTPYEYALYMWDACGFYPEEGIKSLESLSLIKVRDKTKHFSKRTYIRRKIVIHDQLRELGREIIRREDRGDIGICSRLRLEKESMEVMERKQGTNNIQALDLCIDDKEIHLTSQQFEGMKNLRFLRMFNVHLTGDFQNSFSNIVWLCWGWGPRYGGTCTDVMRITFNPRKLVILELFNTNITEHWEGWNQVENLKVLNLSQCNHLRTTPNFSAIKGLDELVLHHCCSLKKIHPSIGKFRKTLKVLDVTGCCALEELPIQVGEMEELRELHVTNTNIRGIPICEGYMKKLQTLFASNAKMLEYVPHTIGSLVQLQQLNLTCCTGLTNIPEDIGKLKFLTHLDLSGTSVTRLPDSIGDLHNLELLNLRGTDIKCLPASIEMLSKVRDLNLWGCMELESLSNLPCSLSDLTFRGDSMETLSDISSLTNLKLLCYIDVFERRNRALNLRNLNQLETLYISHSKWSYRRKLDEASEDINLLLELPLGLKVLEVRGCQTLRTLPNLSYLLKLCLVECPELNCLELEGAESLTYLYIDRCRKLSKLNGMGIMVEVLVLESLDALKSLSILSASKLNCLGISQCSKLVEIQGLEDVEGLDALKINKCCSLKRIADLSHLKTLTTLELCDCEELNNVKGIENLTSLTQLCISEPLLGSQDLSQLTNLRMSEIISKQPPLKEDEESQGDSEDKEGSKSNLDELEKEEESQSDPKDKNGSESNLDELEWNLWLF